MKFKEWRKKMRRLKRLIRKADGAQDPHREETRAACQSLLEEVKPLASRLLLDMLHARMISIDVREHGNQDVFAMLHPEPQIRDVGPLAILVWACSVDFHGQGLPAIRCERSHS